ncbi:hypothetical protein [Paraburkholderia sp. JHI869]|uniref:hypothetical protein n=1 Tax=Paraburkholderia sp. JHI869 TaxID=3112959 RepID=UPI003179BA49
MTTIEVEVIYSGEEGEREKINARNPLASGNWLNALVGAHPVAMSLRTAICRSLHAPCSSTMAQLAIAQVSRHQPRSL